MTHIILIKKTKAVDEPQINKYLWPHYWFPINANLHRNKRLKKKMELKILKLSIGFPMREVLKMRQMKCNWIEMEVKLMMIILFWDELSIEWKCSTVTSSNWSPIGKDILNEWSCFEVVYNINVQKGRSPWITTIHSNSSLLDHT